MTKLKRTKLGLYLSLGMIVLVSVVAIGLVVNAFSSTNNPKVVVEGDYIEAPAMENGEEILGAVTSPDITSPYLAVNGDVAWHVKADAADVNTVLTSIDLSAYGVTVSSSTIVDYVAVKIDGVATSSMVITCGGATGATAVPSYDLMTTGTIATSTGLGCVMSNGLLTADNNASACADGGSIQKIAIGEDIYPYFNCTATGTAASVAVWPAGLTNGGNTFDADIMVNFRTMR